MPDLSGIPAVDVAIGLAFLFFLLSIVCSSINEAIAVVFRLRSRTLAHGVLSLLGDREHAKEFYGHWRIEALKKPAKFLPARRPSYIPSRAFALTLLEHTLDVGEEAVSHRDLMRKARKAVQTGNVGKHRIRQPVRGILQEALADGKNEFEPFLHSIERSFDQTMDRASGWYKRRAQLFLFLISICVVLAINADTFTVGQRLWNDKALRAALVTQANQAAGQKTGTSCAEGDEAAPTVDLTPVEVAQQCLQRVEDLQLPIGWSEGWPDGGRAYFSKFAGLLITAFALTLGAPFWFDLLGKVAQLRGTGPAPAGSVEKLTEARKRRHQVDLEMEDDEEGDEEDEPDTEPDKPDDEVK